MGAFKSVAAITAKQSALFMLEKFEKKLSLPPTDVAAAGD